MMATTMPSCTTTPFSLGHAGFLDLTGSLDGGQSVNLSDLDPAVLRDKLRVTQLAQEVFPNIISGVRFWPFLLVARDELTREGSAKLSSTAVQRQLKSIAAEQRKHPLMKSRSRMRIGPSTLAGYRPYRGMMQSILSSNKNNDGCAMYHFLRDGRRRYEGDLCIFQRHEKRWRKALKASMGPPGRCFAELIDGSAIVKLDDAILEILTSFQRYDPTLVEATAAYALLVCLYGEVKDSRIVASDHSKEFAVHLCKLVKRRPTLTAAIYHPLILQASYSSSPPLEKIHRQRWRLSRRVLSELRFGTFWNLYLKPTPNVLS